MMGKRKNTFLVNIGSEQNEIKQRSSGFFVLLSFLFLFVLTVGIHYGLRSILDFTVSRKVLLEICLFSSVWTTILFHCSKPYHFSGFFEFISLKKIGFAVTGIGTTVYCVQYWSNICKGSQLFANYFFKKMNFYYGTRFSYFLLEGEKEKIVLFVWGLGIFLLTMLCGYCLIEKKQIKIILISALFVIFAGLLIGEMISPGVLFLLMGVVFCSFCLERKNFVGSGKSIYGTVFSISIIAALFITILLAGKLIAEPRFKQPLKQWHENLYQWDSKVNKEIRNHPFYRSINSQLNQLFYKKSSSMLTNQAPNHTGKSVMSITVKADEIKENLYLKGWVGSVYGNNHWESVSEKNFNEEVKKWKLEMESNEIGLSIQNLLYKHLEEFPNEQSYSFVSIDAESYKQQIFIKQLDDSLYKYVPYGVKFGTDVTPYGDGYIKKDNKIQNSYDGYFIYDEFGNEGNTEGFFLIDSERFAEMNKNRSDKTEIIEKKYKEYVQKEYTQVPKEGLEQLKEICKSKQFDFFSSAKFFILKYLQSRAEYSTDLKPLSNGEDFVEHFLLKEKKGFCTHFATTAALMFRMLGYPARYVSGYVVNPSAFEKLEDGYYYAEVPDSNAHAWVEVYIDGKGWIPVEMTPPGYEAAQQTIPYHNNQSVQKDEEFVMEKSKQNTEKETKQPDVKQNKVQKEKEAKENQKEIWDLTLDKILIQGIKKMIWVFGIFVFGICVILVRREILIRTRRKHLLQKDDKKAVREISYEMHRILSHSGYDKKQFVSDKEYGEYISRQLDYWNTDEYGKFLSIVQQVFFSEREISREDRWYCFNIYRKVEKNERKKKRGMEHMYWKYILCY